MISWQSQNMEESKIETLLNIKTTGRDDTRANSFNYPYEPTDYCVLKELVQSGLIGKKNHLIDYGSGKGRVSFYLSYETGCSCTGVELDERLYNRALKNHGSFIKKNKVSFVNENAVNFIVPDDADRMFFFNPFSKEVLAAVLKKIIESSVRNPREILLFFYYPSDEYMGMLMTQNELSFYDEIDCSELFPNSKEINREQIVIFQVIDD